MLLDNTIDRETFKRKHAELRSQIENIENEILELEGQQQMDVGLIEEVLALTRNIYKTYKEASYHLKRHYLRFFFESFLVKNKRIVEVTYTPIFAVLQENHQVILRGNWLARWDDFRTANWTEIVEHPELTLQQTQQLLAITA